MNEQLPWRAEVIDRIEWLVQLRWFAVVGAFGAVTVADARLPGVLPLVHLYGLTGFIAIYNVFFYLYGHELRTWQDDAAKWHAATLLVHGQIVLDLLCLTLLLHYSGGAESPFATYYVLHITLASILLSPLASYVYAGLATLLYIVMILLEYVQAMGHVHLVSVFDPDLYRRETYLFAAAFALTTTLFFAVYLASSITSRLRQRETELYDARLALQARGEELLKANEQLQQLDQTKTRFLLTVTHELRAPVAAIQSYLDLILQGYTAPEKQRAVLQRSRVRTAELLDLIAELLQLARIRELDARRVETQPVEVAAVMLETLELFRAEAAAKNLSVETVVGADEPAWVAATPDHLRIIWTNLISNAIKYTPDSGRVTISVGPAGRVVEGRVQDSGIGVAPESLPHVFDEFFRTDEAKAVAARGTGLGLSITRRLVEMYGGHIEVQSQLGKGTTFTFDLPRLADPPVAEPVSIGEPVKTADQQPTVRQALDKEGTG
jgi:signal transduction histidine kinase